MNIVEWLKSENANARVSIGWRWLVWDGCWEVYERKYSAKKTTLIIATANEEEAVAALLKED